MRFAVSLCIAASVFLIGCAAMRPEPVLCGLDYFAANTPDRLPQVAGMGQAERTLEQVMTSATAPWSGPLQNRKITPLKTSHHPKKRMPS
ncbi:MAG: hypothetical protein AAFY31_07570, partial [Pseudomonadota bacterium]